MMLVGDAFRCSFTLLYALASGYSFLLMVLSQMLVFRLVREHLFKAGTGWIQLSLLE